MPLYHYACKGCGYEVDTFFPMNDRADSIECPDCGGSAKYRISCSTVDCSSECPKWIGSVADVVDPSQSREANDFYRDRTRENYLRFMKASGKRHLEPGEEVGTKPKPADLTPVKKRIADDLRKSRRIEV